MPRLKLLSRTARNATSRDLAVSIAKLRYVLRDRDMNNARKIKAVVDHDRSSVRTRQRDGKSRPTQQAWLKSSLSDF